MGWDGLGWIGMDWGGSEVMDGGLVKLAVGSEMDEMDEMGEGVPNRGEGENRLELSDAAMRRNRLRDRTSQMGFVLGLCDCCCGQGVSGRGRVVERARWLVWSVVSSARGVGRGGEDVIKGVW